MKKIGFLFLAFTLPLCAQVVQVAMEPFPPLIVDKDSGYTIELLNAVTEKTGIVFEVQIMPYNRAKQQLKDGQVGMMAHTPKGVEEESFYTYAQELDFSISTTSDVYAKDKSKLADISSIKIAIPRGNEDFASMILGVPKENFYPGELEGLLKMLNAGRIDAFWFERASTMSTLEKLKISGIHYTKLPAESPDAGFAFAKNEDGTQLKTKIDAAIKKIDTDKLFADYYKYLELPATGVTK